MIFKQPFGRRIQAFSRRIARFYNMKNIYELIRPYQYIKNLFIFLPLFFGLEIGNLYLLFKALVAFTAFSLTASGVYVINDYHDIEEDRRHPKKRYRPMASGVISKSQGLGIMAFLFLAGFTAMGILSWKAIAFQVAYVCMNIAYSMRLKQIAILDITIIAVGFVLRLFIGSAVTGIPLSQWIVIMTFLLALFLALAKRRDDVLIFNETGKKMRKAIDGYNLQFLDIAMAVMASVVIVSYILFTVLPTRSGKVQSEYLYTTVIFVITGILRYMSIAFVLNDSGSPTRVIMKDLFLKIILLGWIVTYAWILY